MMNLEHAVKLGASVRGRDAVLLELRAQQIICKAQVEAGMDHLARLDNLVAELESRADGEDEL